MDTQVHRRPLHCKVHLPDMDARWNQSDLGRQDHKVERPIRDRRTNRNVPVGMGTDKLGEIMPDYGNQTPQVGDLYVSETRGRLHILISFEIVDFSKYYRAKFKRLDDGAITSWTKPQHEFYRKYKPLQPDPQAQTDIFCPRK